MVKNDEIIERIHDIELDNAYKKGASDTSKAWWRLTHTVCITATSSIGGFFIWLGGYIYSNFSAVEVGVKAFILALRGVK